MLMAAVTSTLPGMEKANTIPVLSGRTESAGMSFAESFDEVPAVSGETPPHIANQIKSMLPAEGVDSVPDEKPSTTTAVADSETRVSTSVTGKMPNVPTHVKLPVAPVIEKTSVPVASKASSITAISLPQGGGKLGSGTDKAIQSEMSDGQFSLVSSGDPKNLAQKPVHGVTEGSELDGVDGTTNLEQEITDPAAPPLTASDMKRVIANKSEIPIPDKSHDASSIKRVVTNGDISVKKEKGTKAGDKTEEKVAIAASAVGIDVQTTVSIPAVVSPIGGQQAGAETASDANLLSPIIPAAFGGGVGIKVAAKNKGSKETVDMEKSDGSSMKTSDPSLVENTAPQKADADVAKVGLAVGGNPDGDKVKEQRMAALVTDSGQIHAGSAAPGAMVSGGSGGVLTQNVGGNLAVTAAISHAVSTAQTGSNPTDSTVLGDTGHKTLMVTPTSLEVGVSNGTHGWLKIRAEMVDGGAINTSLSAASSSGQEMLHRELPSLTAYLQSEHVAVNAVVVQTAIAGGADLRNSFGGGGGEHGQAHQSDGQGRENRQDSTNSADTHAPIGPLYSSLNGAGGDEVLSPGLSIGGGNWLSVRA